MNQSKYVVFDGMDGSGKGTQIDLLKPKFPDAVFTREPGGTLFAEEIRKLVRDNPLAAESTPLNNFLLFWAAREDLVDRLVVPELRGGKHVFSDRGDSSTFAYQIYGEQQTHLHDLFLYLRQHVFGAKGRRKPNLYIVYDLPSGIARERAMSDTNRATNHYDERSPAYYDRVRQGFGAFAEHHRTYFVDATRTREQMHESTMKILRENGVE